MAGAPIDGGREYIGVFSPWTNQAEVAQAAGAAGASLLALPSRFIAAVSGAAWERYENVALPRPVVVL